MTDQDRQSITESLPGLKLHLLHRFLTSLTLKGIAEHRKQDALFEYDTVLDYYLQRHLMGFKVPAKTDDSFNVALSFQDSFIRNMEGYALLNLGRRLRADIYITTPLSHLSEEQVARASEKHREEAESMEGIVEKDLIQRKLENMNRVFCGDLNTLEKKLFAAMRDGMTWNALIDFIGPTQSTGAKLTKTEAQHIRNLIEFRLVCHYAVNRFLDADVIKRAMGKHTNLMKRFFHTEKFSNEEPLPLDHLDAIAKGKITAKDCVFRLPRFRHGELPDLELIRQKVREVFPDAKENSNPKGKWRWCSRLHKGKRHDHPVSFINRRGYAYSHVDKTTVNILTGEAAS
jgi:hypothetical protein